MSQVYAAIATGVLVLIGVWLKGKIDVNRIKAKHAREDHNHRQAYYHDLQVTTKTLIELAWHTHPHDSAGVGEVVEAQFTRQVKGVRTFGTPAARDAAQQLEGAWDGQDEPAMRDALRELEAAAIADVGPT